MGIASFLDHSHGRLQEKLVLYWQLNEIGTCYPSSLWDNSNYDEFDYLQQNWYLPSVSAVLTAAADIQMDEKKMEDFRRRRKAGQGTPLRESPAAAGPLSPAAGPPPSSHPPASSESAASLAVESTIAPPVDEPSMPSGPRVPDGGTEASEPPRKKSKWDSKRSSPRAWQIPRPWPAPGRRPPPPRSCRSRARCPNTGSTCAATRPVF